MITVTDAARDKFLEIMAKQDQRPLGVRASVVGGGCSGFQYSLAMETVGAGPLDKVHTFGELKVFVDQASMLYLDGVNIDYVETLEGAGFKFSNPHVKNTCGCGSSFQV